MYVAQWKRVDPVIVAIQRDEIETPSGRREKVSLDVHISPYARTHYAFFAGFLGEPDKWRLAPVKGNVIEGQARIATFSAEPRDPPYRIFGGLRDVAPPFAFHEGRVIPGGVNIDDAQFYLGSTPAAGVMPFIRVGNIPDGYSENEDGGWFRWIRKFDDFAVQAGQKAILESVTPQIKLEEAERPAQCRAHRFCATHAFATSAAGPGGRTHDDVTGS